MLEPNRCAFRDLRDFISSRHTLVRVWVLLRLVSLNCFAVYRFVRPQLVYLSFICSCYFNWVAFYLVLACVLRFAVGISLLGEVNRLVTRLITRGDVVLRLQSSGLCIWSQIGVSLSDQIENYPYVMEDRATQFPSCCHPTCVPPPRRPVSEGVQHVHAYTPSPPSFRGPKIPKHEKNLILVHLKNRHG
jgi:hypothetical protein